MVVGIREYEEELIPLLRHPSDPNEQYPWGVEGKKKKEEEERNTSGNRIPWIGWMGNDTRPAEICEIEIETTVENASYA